MEAIPKSRSKHLGQREGIQTLGCILSSERKEVNTGNQNRKRIVGWKKGKVRPKESWW